MLYIIYFTLTATIHYACLLLPGKGNSEKKKSVKTSPSDGFNQCPDSRNTD